MIEMEEENEYDCSLPGNNGSFTIKEWAKEDRPRENSEEVKGRRTRTIPHRFAEPPLHKGARGTGEE